MTRRRARLDRAAIKRLEPGQSLNEDGITAQCMPNRDVRYTINVMVDGRRIHKAIGFASAGVTLTQCQQFIERARSEARADRLELPKGRKLAMTLATAAPPIDMPAVRPVDMTPAPPEQTASIETVKVQILPDGRMDCKNAALYMGNKEKTLATWRTQGKGPRFVKVGGRVFYYRDDLDAEIGKSRRGQ